MGNDQAGLLRGASVLRRIEVKNTLSPLLWRAGRGMLHLLLHVSLQFMTILSHKQDKTWLTYLPMGVITETFQLSALSKIYFVIEIKKQASWFNTQLYGKAIRRGYLTLDLKPTTHDRHRLKTNLLPRERGGLHKQHRKNTMYNRGRSGNGTYL